ncbi:MAG TPA: LURP-one-related family protein [Candidatus Angelobacter sp.]|nr:LURP-one-related family protein [Candidatus Angelobacter sp.]
MKQKLFSLGNDFLIKDETGRDVFLVDSKAFTLRNQLSFQDLAGKELASITHETPWGSTYPPRGCCLGQGA